MAREREALGDPILTDERKLQIQKDAQQGEWPESVLYIHPGGDDTITRQREWHSAMSAVGGARNWPMTPTGQLLNNFITIDKDYIAVRLSNERNDIHRGCRHIRPLTSTNCGDTTTSNQRRAITQKTRKRNETEKVSSVKLILHSTYEVQESERKIRLRFLIKPLEKLMKLFSATKTHILVKSRI